tara:strand:- start:136 stop:441 length:306 start_codon:yes stop_codon:yes gene_type:complete
MPTYTFFDEDTDETFDMFLSMAQREQYLKRNRRIRQVPVAVAIAGDHIMGVGPKVDGGFNDRMEQIANSHPGSPLADRYGGSSKSHKEIKTRDTLKKHRVI